MKTSLSANQWTDGWFQEVLVMVVFVGSRSTTLRFLQKRTRQTIIESRYSIAAVLN